MRKNKKEQIKLTPVKLSNANDPFGKFCKVYNDGSHFVAVPTCYLDRVTKTIVDKRCLITNEEEKAYFDELYATFLMQGVKANKMFCFIKDAMLEKYPDLKDADEFINKNIARQRHNYFSRLKRFKRKANLNIWNKWVTITYDPKKHNEVTFKKKLKKCLSNLHTRRGWNYMGVFELAPETQRLHFHAIMYIPDNEMIGTIEERQDYSTAQHQMQTTHSNSFFADAFGRNDFEELTDADLKSGRILSYLTKYLSKSGEKIVYSRGIPSELKLYIEHTDLIVEYIDYVRKFVLLDDCINKRTGYTAWRPPKYKQSSFIDYELCCV